MKTHHRVVEFVARKAALAVIYPAVYAAHAVAPAALSFLQAIDRWDYRHRTGQNNQMLSGWFARKAAAFKKFGPADPFTQRDQDPYLDQ